MTNRFLTVLLKILHFAMRPYLK